MLLAVILAATAVGLLGLAGFTARRPAEPVPGLDGYYASWSALHGGYDPGANVWVRGWLRLCFGPARLLARAGVHPDVVTLWSGWLAGVVVAVAALGGPWPVLAALLVVVSGFVDNLDGAVAALTNRVSRWGYVLDSLVDRLSDLAFLGAVAVAGGDPRLAAVGAALVLLHEYVRALAGNAGAGEIGVVTVAERPTRIIVVAFALVAVGLAGDRVPDLATAGLWVFALLQLAGLVQLLVAVRRRLR